MHENMETGRVGWGRCDKPKSPTFFQREFTAHFPPRIPLRVFVLALLGTWWATPAGMDGLVPYRRPLLHATLLLALCVPRSAATVREL
jgi:hypothetical protein